MKERRLSKKEKLSVLWASHPQLLAGLERTNARAERAERECSVLRAQLESYRCELDELVKRLAEQVVTMPHVGQDEEEDVTLDEIMTEWTEGAKNER